MEYGNHVKRRFICLIVVALVTSARWRQDSVAWEASANSPTETVETLWIMASAGELLTAEGWQEASGFFTQPLPPPKPGIRVVSNIWGPAGPPKKFAGFANVVSVGCRHWGTIDSALRFTPAPKTDAVKESDGYSLVFAPEHFRTIENGKLVQHEQTGKYKTWQIAHPLDMPFTSVNTAIRYILEKRAKTTDPVIKQNADKTLAALLRLH
jgi:hypothetical protein